MTEICFTSRITAVSPNEFSGIAAKIGNKFSVNYPWTINESVKAPNSYTKDIYDCSACLITDGQDALLMHLCPTTSQNNHSTNNILTYLRNKLKLTDPNLQAVLIGSQKNKNSLDVYDKLLELLKKLGIPVSELKSGKGATNIAYRSDTDEVYITNKAIEKSLEKGLSSKDSLLSCFEKVSISEYDEI